MFSFNYFISISRGTMFETTSLDNHNTVTLLIVLPVPIREKKVDSWKVNCWYTRVSRYKIILLLFNILTTMYFHYLPARHKTSTYLYFLKKSVMHICGLSCYHVIYWYCLVIREGKKKKWSDESYSDRLD